MVLLLQFLFMILIECVLTSNWNQSSSNDVDTESNRVNSNKINWIRMLSITCESLNWIMCADGWNGKPDMSGRWKAVQGINYWIGYVHMYWYHWFITMQSLHIDIFSIFKIQSVSQSFERFKEKEKNHQFWLEFCYIDWTDQN